LEVATSIGSAESVAEKGEKEILDLVESETISISTRIPLKSRTLIGAKPGADVRIFGEGATPFHAEITVDREGNYDLIDLGSDIGCLVNGQQVVKRQRLLEGDLLQMANSSFYFVGSALESIEMISVGHTLKVEGLSLEIAGKKLLQDVNFQLKPGSLTAILGPSGAGKSTLLAAMTGRIQAATGKVSFGGLDLRVSAKTLASSIGFVPQSDLLHTRLKTKEAIEYGAKLRFPKGTSSQAISARVDEVLQELELTERASLRIDKLSGGQRKRASVALELLTEPALLFLDEPTSGLDPGLDRQVMALLRKLADSGKTVVVVTHSVSNLDFADDLVLMAAGGRLGYFGSPQSVFIQMGTTDWAEIFEKLATASAGLARKAKPLRAISRWDNSSELASPAMQSWSMQFAVLMRRYLKVIASDKGYLAFLGLLPFLVAGVGSLTGSKYGLGQGPEWRDYLNLEARPLLLVLILGAAFIGASTSIQELVKERVIFAREKSVGLRVSAYIASKVLILSAIVAAQVSLFVVLTLASRPIPEQALVLGEPMLELVFALVALGLVSMALGLLASALVETPDVTMPILVALTMVQVVLSGAVPVSVDWLLDTLGPVVPAYWIMNMLAVTTDLNALSFIEQADYLKAWESTAANFGLSAAIVAGMFLVFVFAAGLVARKATPGR
jgi:ABC-type multidrug transport system ATPase subunit